MNGNGRASWAKAYGWIREAIESGQIVMGS